MSETSPAAALLFLRDEELRQGYELLYFAHRDLSEAAAPLLAARGLGPGHQRVIQFLGRQNQIATGELCTLTGLSKQSLGRVVEVLAAQDLVTQRPGLSDRRQRLLALTDSGHVLEREIWARQHRLIAKAYRECGPQAIDSFRKVLIQLIGAEADRARFERRPATAPGR